MNEILNNNEFISSKISTIEKGNKYLLTFSIDGKADITLRILKNGLKQNLIRTQKVFKNSYKFLLEPIKTGELLIEIRNQSDSNWKKISNIQLIKT